MTMLTLSHAKKAAKNLSVDSSLRALILRQPDFLSELEFLAKVEVWLSLLEIESKNADAAPATAQPQTPAKSRQLVAGQDSR